MRCAAAIGMFDGVHLGHQSLIADLCREAQAIGTVPMAVTFESHPMSLIDPARAPRLLTTEIERTSLLRKYGCQIVHMLNFNEELRQLTAREFMRKLHRELEVDMIVLGFNHRFGSDRIRDFEQYRQIGQEEGIEVKQSTELVIDGLDRPVSSSQIRQALADGRLDIANAMLGRCFSLSGTVAHGKEIGRTIGYPTANVVPPSELIIPKRGAYATVAMLAGEQWPAMVNIGKRPTINDPDAESTIEAHLIGYDGNLYGKSIALEFVKRLRDEQRYPSLQALAAQLESDRQEALQAIKIDKQ